MASEVRSEVAELDPIVSQLRRDGTARLRFSPATIKLLQEQSLRLNLPVGEILTQAVTLFQVAVEAQARGEQVCLINDDLDIVGEIEDFGATTGVDVEPDFEEEANQDEQ